MEYFIRIDYEKIFIRLSSISYGASESEKLKYDTWGKLVEKSKNGAVSKFKYDYFGRLVEKLCLIKTENLFQSLNIFTQRAVN